MPISWVQIFIAITTGTNFFPVYKCRRSRWELLRLSQMHTACTKHHDSNNSILSICFASDKKPSPFFGQQNDPHNEPVTKVWLFRQMWKLHLKKISNYLDKSGSIVQLEFNSRSVWLQTLYSFFFLMHYSHWLTPVST